VANFAIDLPDASLAIQPSAIHQAYQPGIATIHDFPMLLDQGGSDGKFHHHVAIISQSALVHSYPY
jgi:hypothetical protein